MKVKTFPASLQTKHLKICLSLLIDKGIITLDELGTKMRENVDTWPSLQQLKKNYESLMTLIRYETDADVNDDAMN